MSDFSDPVSFLYNSSVTKGMMGWRREIRIMNNELRIMEIQFSQMYPKLACGGI